MCTVSSHKLVRAGSSISLLMSTFYLHFLTKRKDTPIAVWLECSWSTYNGPGTVLRAIPLKILILKAILMVGRNEATEVQLK